MAVTSPATTLGAALPGTVLPDLNGIPVDLAGLAAGRPLLVVFSCNHCPYVRHVESKLGDILAGFGDQIAVAAISPNDVAHYPDDDVPRLREQADRAKWAFPYLVDTDQSAARAFAAVCTPDFFLFGTDLRLVYRGAFDNSTPGNDLPLTGADLSGAIESVLSGTPPAQPQRPTMGCSIKWKDA